MAAKVLLEVVANYIGRGVRGRGVRGRGNFSYEMKGRNTANNTSNNVVCHNCNKEGHIARDCPKNKVKCYNCNELGHLAKYCKAPRSLRCSRCGQSNQTSQNCTASVEEMNEWRKDGKKI